MSVERPLTHDLLRAVIASLGANVTRIVVSDLNNDIFYAKIVLHCNGSTMEVDSRVADAIALAVRTDAPIFANSRIVDGAGVEMDEETGTPIKQDKDDAYIDAGVPSVTVIKPDQRSPNTAQTSNMVRQAGIARDTCGAGGLWIGYVSSPPGPSGAHHHATPSPASTF